MATVVSELWFSDRGQPFRGKESYYFDKGTFPWMREIEAQWTVIRDELLELVERPSANMVPYANREMTSKDGHWKTFGLMFWTIRSKKNCAMVPKTWQLLRSIPNITAASFNLLEGGATIKPHYGDTNAIARCHLGLVVPASAPECAFRVGKEVRSWKEGEFFAFCDAHSHTAWNNTDKKRYILIVDVMRPEFVSKKAAISSRVLAAINLEIAYQRNPWLAKVFGTKGGKRLLLGIFRAYYWSIIQLKLFT